MFGKLTKSQFKSIKSLKQKKFRDENRLFLIEGKKMVDEAMNSTAEIKMILVQAGTKASFGKAVDIFELSSKEMDIISGMKTAPEVMAVCSFLPESELDFNKSILALDGVSDPGNLGTIIRVCDWFGIEQLVCHPGTVELYNPKVVQATMGSLFRVNVFTEALEDFLDRKPKNLQAYSADMDGESAYTAQLMEPFILIMGSESHGVRREILERSDAVLSIPAFGKAESLNVAVATSVLLSEFKRRQS
jgi:TrmH family RNA methyltransferase